MTEAVKSLARSIEELRGSTRLTLGHVDAQFDQALGPGELGPEAMFRDMFGYECPDSLKDGLYLPEAVSFDWRHAERIAGETSLSNHFVSTQRLLDESVQGWTMEGFSLSEMRIMDAVLIQGGPIYTLVHLAGDQISETLYVFDTRELFQMEITYREYLRQLAVSKGILYWQYLFCQGLRLKGFERAVLERQIGFLRSEFPPEDYGKFRSKLEEKGARA